MKPELSPELTKEQMIQAIVEHDYKTAVQQSEHTKGGWTNKTAVIQVQSDTTGGMTHLKISANGGTTWVNRSL